MMDLISASCGGLESQANLGKHEIFLEVKIFRLANPTTSLKSRTSPTTALEEIEDPETLVLTMLGHEGADNANALNIAYLGPEASFSHQAAIELFEPPNASNTTRTSTRTSTGTGRTEGREVVLHPLPSFSAIFSSLQNSPSRSTGTSDTDPQTPTFDYAVIPIENSTNGSVVQVLDLLAQCGLQPQAPYPDLEVCAEYYLPVHHCLFISSGTSTRGETMSASASNDGESAKADLTADDDAKTSIRTLYTHPQVWGQCGRFLAAHLPPNAVERIDVGSTSAAAQLVARGTDADVGRGAAIASRLAGQRHGLVCLAEDIEDEPGSNTTRFFVVRNRRTTTKSHHLELDLQLHLQQQQHSASPGGADDQTQYKSLITFTIPHSKPGSLADALAVFKQYSFNLTSIDTRPSRKRNWQYVFFVECEETTQSLRGAGRDHLGEENLTNMLCDLGKFTESLRYLGRFEDQLQRDEGTRPEG